MSYDTRPFMGLPYTYRTVIHYCNSGMRCRGQVLVRRVLLKRKETKATEFIGLFMT
jgi:hypothetical protein